CPAVCGLPVRGRHHPRSGDHPPLPGRRPRRGRLPGDRLHVATDRRSNEKRGTDMSGWEKSAITLAVFLPAAGALVIAVVPRSRDRLIRGLGILFTGVPLVIGIVMLFGFDFGGRGGLQFELDTSWISSIGARYHVGI